MMVNAERRKGKGKGFMKSHLASILKGSGRMRIMLALQACFVFALYTIWLTNATEKEPAQEPLLVPIRVDEWKAATPKVRIRRQDKPESFAAVSKRMEEKEYPPHAPDFFTDKVSFETLLARDNLLSVYTGCSIATWTYGWHEHKPRLASFYDDCGHYNAEMQWTGRDITVETVSEIQSGDSVYVELKKLDHFAMYLLPLIKVDVVLLSGQNHVAPMKPPIRPPYSKHTFRNVIGNSKVTHWFMMNLDKHSFNPFHPKVSKLSPVTFMSASCLHPVD